MDDRTDAGLEKDASRIQNDDALCEMLGINSLDGFFNVTVDEDCRSDESRIPRRSRSLDELLLVKDSVIGSMLLQGRVTEVYEETSVIIFPDELSIPADLIRRLTDEVVWGVEKYKADRTFETIKVWKNGSIQERSILTRLENLNCHPGWNALCNDYIRRCVSSLMGKDYLLFKTKLNLKPAGGSGFAPHVDTPSLKVPFGDMGPQSFVTVMIAIDPMTVSNGCLRVAKGQWSESKSCYTIPPQEDASPDAGGRAGAIPMDVSESLVYADICCESGAIVVFDGWVPHRSGVNQTHFSRRAIFLTFNLASEGDFHDAYYERMSQIRQKWRISSSLSNSRSIATVGEIDPIELSALATIPRI